MPDNLTPENLRSSLQRNLVFVHGKGGVGKTLVSQAIAHRLSEGQKRTLWVTLEDPTRAIGEVQQLNSHLWTFNADFNLAFEEYAALKIGAAHLTRLFLKNKLMRYMAKVAPGIHELVLLGKIWHERLHYDHVVVDLPSTGHGLALFQSTDNFVRLFRGGPLNRDAEEMLDTFRDPLKTCHLIVALPEEMPLRESLELNDYLTKMFPENPAQFLVNRVFPEIPLTEEEKSELPQNWKSPVAHSLDEYAKKRYRLERFNLRLWKDANIQFGELDFIPPAPHDSLISTLSQQFQDKAYL